jgi:hypothetical protein
MSSLATSAGTIPGGGALVTDPGSPATNYVFAGPGQQAYKREVTCDAGASASGAITTTATLTASNGQQISQSATVQKQCYDLRVSVASKASPYVGRWGWSVTKTASPTSIALRPDAKAYAGSTTGSFGRDYATTTTADVVYSVTFRRSPPAGAVAGAPAFEAAGEVYVQNPAPINARLQGVYVTISNARGGAPYVAPATCPVLVVPAGQRITCSWRANPTFNPVGQQVGGGGGVGRGAWGLVGPQGRPDPPPFALLRGPRPAARPPAPQPPRHTPTPLPHPPTYHPTSPKVRATARYINSKNGEPSAATTDFNSSPATIGGGDDAAAPARRRLQQTWGGAAGLAAQGAANLIGNVYDLNGGAVVVPNSVASGSGVVVSGNSAIHGPVATPIAMSADAAVPVILPSTGRPSVNSGFYVNEAGPAAVAQAVDDALSGLQDECADVGDSFVSGDGQVRRARGEAGATGFVAALGQASGPPSPGVLNPPPHSLVQGAPAQPAPSPRPPRTPPTKPGQGRHCGGLPAQRPRVLHHHLHLHRALRALPRLRAPQELQRGDVPGRRLPHPRRQPERRVHRRRGLREPRGAQDRAAQGGDERQGRLHVVGGPPRRPGRAADRPGRGVHGHLHRRLQADRRQGRRDARGRGGGDQPDGVPDRDRGRRVHGDDDVRRPAADEQRARHLRCRVGARQRSCHVPRGWVGALREQRRLHRGPHLGRRLLGHLGAHRVCLQQRAARGRQHQQPVRARQGRLLQGRRPCRRQARRRHAARRQDLRQPELHLHRRVRALQQVWQPQGALRGPRWGFGGGAEPSWGQLLAAQAGLACRGRSAPTHYLTNTPTPPPARPPARPTLPSPQAVSTAALASNSSTPAVSAASALPIHVVGCNLYSDMSRAADCVQPASWWASCDAEADAKCASGWKLLPGGRGKETLFFPKPNERSDRTYEALLADGAAAGLSAARVAYLDASREFITAQLNFLSGARLPTVELQDAFDALNGFLATTSENTFLGPNVVQALGVQAGLLGRYNSGATGDAKAPARC